MRVRGRGRAQEPVAPVETEAVEAPPPPPPPPAPAPSAPRSEFGRETGTATAPPATDAVSGRLEVTLADGRRIEATAIDGAVFADGRQLGRVARTADGVEVIIDGVTRPARSLGETATAPRTEAPESWPNGPPSSYVKARFPPTPETQPDRQLMIDTVLGVLPASQREATRALLETGGEFGAGTTPGAVSKPGGVSDESLRKAFDAVLAARNAPGQKTLELSLVPTRIDTREINDESSSRTEVSRSEGEPVKLSVSVEVDARGRVNGAPLVADQLTRLGTETTRVPIEEKQKALEEAGVPREWMAWASEEQKTQALARIRDAGLTPGEKTIDLSFDRQETIGGGDGDSRVETRRVDGRFTLTVGDKPLRIDVAVATTNQFDQLPVADKAEMLERIGFPAEDVKKIAPERMTSILTRVSMTARDPGEHALEVDTGPDKFRVGMKVSQQGDIEAIGAEKLPPPPKKKKWQKILGPVLTVASIAFPAAAPFIRVAQAGLAIASGARGLNLVGAIVGAASGVSSNLVSAGLISSSTASVLSTANQAIGVARNVQGAVRSFRSGDVLGGLGSALAAGQGAAGIVGGPNSEVAGRFAQAGNLVRGVGSAVAAIRGRDPLGALGAVLDTARAAGAEGLGTARNLVSLVEAARRRDALGAAGIALDLANERGLLGSAGETARDAVSVAEAVRDRDFAGILASGGSVLERLFPGLLTSRDAPPAGAPAAATPAPASGSTAADDARGSEPTPAVPDEIFGPPAPESIGANAPPRGEVTVRAGETLTSLAARHLGGADKWPLIYLYNRDVIGQDPNALRAGATLQLPPEGYDPSRADQNSVIRTAHRERTPPSTYLADGVIGFDDEGNPVPSTQTPEQRKVTFETVKRSFDVGETAEKAKDLVKSVGDLNTVLRDPVLAREVAEGLARGDLKALGKVFTDEEAVERLLKQAGNVNPEALERARNFSKTVSVMTAAIAGYEGYKESASGTDVGRLLNGIGAMGVDVLLGRASPALDVVDALTNIAATAGKAITGRDATKETIESLGVKKNLSQAIENVFVVAEALASTPEKRAELITRLADKINSDKGGAVVRGYYKIGEGLANTDFVNWGLDKLVEYEARQKQRAAVEAERQRLIRRNQIRAQGG